MLGVLLLSIAMQTATGIAPSAATPLNPMNVDPAPTIDGVMETSWTRQTRPVLELKNSSTTQLLQVYTTVFNDFIFFGLVVRKATHSNNEGLAIVCSNLASETAVDDSVFSYSVAKIVKIDGSSWDWKIRKDTSDFIDWSEENGNSIDLKVGFISGNFSFYEFRFARVLTREYGGDVNWSRKQSYMIKIFHGTQFGDVSEFYRPMLEEWTMATDKISLYIPAAPDDPLSPEIKELELNLLIWKTVLFVIAGGLMGLVGFYIVGTKERIRRI